MLRQAIYTGLVLIIFPLVIFPNGVDSKVVDRLIAVIDGEPFTLTNISEYAKTKMVREFPSGDLNQINKGDREVLETFITEKLMDAEVRAAGIKVSEGEIDRYVEQIKAKNQLTDEELKTALSREGATLESYRASVKSQLEKTEILQQQVRKRVNITNEDVERYYKLNAKKYKTEQRVRLRHILFAVPESASSKQIQESMNRASEIYQRIASGEDFAALAREFSEGAGAAKGGDIGWINRKNLLKGIDEVAFGKLSVGEVSRPFRTSMGVHLVKLDERDEGSPLPLSAVAGKIKEELYAKALEERFQKWLKTDLRRKHRVDVKLEGVVFRPEDTKEGTVSSLMASASKGSRKSQRGFWSYLNPLSYIFEETPLEGEDSDEQLLDKNVVRLFGTPLFTSESADDVPADPLAPIEGASPAVPSPQPAPEQNSGESGGFFSSVLDKLNPFSSNP